MAEGVLDLLYALLFRIPDDDDLADYLQSHPIPGALRYSTGVRLQSTIFAVQIYIEVRSLEAYRSTWTHMLCRRLLEKSCPQTKP